MKPVNPQLQLLLALARTQAMLARRLDRGLDGLSFNEFIILHHLNRAPGNTLSRTDLADQVGLTASGVTRLLLPMEKIGLVKKQAHPGDGRISSVKIAPGGLRKLEEATERAERLAGEFVPAKSVKFEELVNLLNDMSSKAK